ncbi:MAG: MopE-related protein [Myxococcales bacterium]|nr:MopE-related protein [Myxococcales bacterium]
MSISTSPEPRRRRRLALLGVPIAALLGFVLGSCLGQGITLDRSLDPALVTISPGTLVETVDLRAAAGAVEGAWRIRATGPNAATATAVMEDGSFEILGLPGLPTDIYYFEAISDVSDAFLVALQEVEGAIVVAEVGDRDGDGSPDAVDCAPENSTRGGSRCERSCSLEICGNSIDENCDGLADEGCGIAPDLDLDGVEAPSDCDEGDPTVFPGATERCDLRDGDCDMRIDDGCVGICSADVQCPVDAICDEGVCVCADPLALCGGVCVDLERDSEHCGACDIQCQGGTSCVASTCIL